MLAMTVLRNGQTKLSPPNLISQLRDGLLRAPPAKEMLAGKCCREVPLAGAGPGPGSELGSGRSHVAFSLLIPVEPGSAQVCCMACGGRHIPTVLQARGLRGWPDQSDAPQAVAVRTDLDNTIPELWNAWGSLRRPICVCICPFLAHTHTQKHTHPSSSHHTRQQQVQTTQPHGVHTQYAPAHIQRVQDQLVHGTSPEHAAVASRPSPGPHAHAGGADLHGTHKARCRLRHFDVDARSTCQ